MTDTTPDRPNAFTVGMIIIGLALAVLLSLGACRVTAYDVAVRTARSLQQARDLTAKQLAASAAARHAECKAQYGVKNEAFANCIRSHRKALEVWQETIRPILDTVCSAAIAALQTTALVKACKAARDCDKRILKLIAPGACALLRGLKAFGHLLPDGAGAVLSVLGSFEGLVCDGSS